MLAYKYLVWDPTARLILSPTSPMVWTGGVATAKCYGGQWFPTDGFGVPDKGQEPAYPEGAFESHQAPAEGCHCGIYAVGDFLLLTEYAHNSGLLDFLGSRLLFGLVEGFGKILEYEAGWRFEQARILAIAPPWDMARRWAYWAAAEAAEQVGARYFKSASTLNKAESWRHPDWVKY